VLNYKELKIERH